MRFKKIYVQRGEILEIKRYCEKKIAQMNVQSIQISSLMREENQLRSP
jgi:hypothetical protein